MSTSELMFIVVFGSISIGCLIYALSQDVATTCASVLGTFIGFVCIGGVIAITEQKTPKPIDVYRGKTTLQIIYQDSIPIDTTVVWKEEFNPNK